MKTTTTLKCIVLFAVALVLAACSSDDNDQPVLRNVRHSGCKSYASAAKGNSFDDFLGKETVSLKAMKNGCMRIIHTNARFTCDAKIGVKAKVDGSTISLTEYAPPTTNCICPYDVDTEIGPMATKDYTLVLKCNDATVLTQSFSYSSDLDKTFDAVH